MTSQTISPPQPQSHLETTAWTKLGLTAAVISMVAVLAVQAVALTFWPEIALFKPLDNYARSALFVFVPAMAATAIFAWLVRQRPQPVRDFIRLSAVVLLLSFIPDYILPDVNKTVLASTVAASLHVVAGLIIVLGLVLGYQRARR